MNHFVELKKALEALIDPAQPAQDRIWAIAQELSRTVARAERIEYRHAMGLIARLKDMIGHPSFCVSSEPHWRNLLHVMARFSDGPNSATMKEWSAYCATQRGCTYTLVLKGGGVRGLAFAGALRELLPYYQFDHFVGTSAGAITAVLLAAGMTPEELEQLLLKTDFASQLDGPKLRTLQIWRLLGRGHIHPGDKFETWINAQLNATLNRKGAASLKDIYQKTGNHLTLYTAQADIDGLPLTSKSEDNCQPYGNTSHIPACRAARMSMSIPLFFEPTDFNGKACYDGGLVANYPLELGLREGKHDKLLGIYLGEPVPEFLRTRRPGVLSTFAQVFSILVGRDEFSLTMQHDDKTVFIDTEPIGSLAFDLTNEEKQYLVLQGRRGALRFLVDRCGRQRQKGNGSEGGGLITKDGELRKCAEMEAQLSRVDDEVALLLPRVLRKSKKRKLRARIRFALGVATLSLAGLFVLGAAAGLVLSAPDTFGGWMTYEEWRTKDPVLPRLFDGDSNEESANKDLLSRAYSLPRFRLDRDERFIPEHATIDSLMIYFDSQDPAYQPGSGVTRMVSIKFQMVTSESSKKQFHVYSSSHGTVGNEEADAVFCYSGSKSTGTNGEYDVAELWNNVTGSRGGSSDRFQCNSITVAFYKGESATADGDFWIIDCPKWASVEASSSFGIVSTRNRIERLNAGLYEIKAPDITGARIPRLLGGGQDEPPIMFRMISEEDDVSGVPINEFARIGKFQEWAAFLDNQVSAMGNPANAPAALRFLVKLRAHMGRSFEDMFRDETLWVYPLQVKRTGKPLVVKFAWEGTQRIASRSTAKADPPAETPRSSRIEE